MTYNKVRTCRLPCLFLASVILSSISLAQDLSGRVINATGTHTFQTQQLNFTTANAEIYRWTANVVVVDNLNKPANQSIPFSNDRYIAVGNLSGKNISITDPSKITRDVCAIAFSPFAQYTTQELDYNDGNGGCSKPLGSNCLASIEKAIKGAAVVTSNGTLDCENLAQSVASTLNLDNIRKDCKWFGTDGGFATYPQSKSFRKTFFSLEWCIGGLHTKAFFLGRRNHTKCDSITFGKRKPQSWIWDVLIDKQSDGSFIGTGIWLRSVVGDVLVLFGRSWIRIARKHYRYEVPVHLREAGYHCRRVEKCSRNESSWTIKSIFRLELGSCGLCCNCWIFAVDS